MTQNRFPYIFGGSGGGGGPIEVDSPTATELESPCDSIELPPPNDPIWVKSRFLQYLEARYPSQQTMATAADDSRDSAISCDIAQSVAQFEAV